VHPVAGLILGASAAMTEILKLVELGQGDFEL
jgi:hypothetical protein